jgi:hypothetical protein
LFGEEAPACDGEWVNGYSIKSIIRLALAELFEVDELLCVVGMAGELLLRMPEA